MNPVTLAAYDYLSAGLAVIALTGKAPNTTHHPHGLRNAIVGMPEGAADDALLAQVFEDPETTGIGIVIQPPMVVVDVDGEAGAQALAVILGTTELEIETPIARTGRGLHIWFWDLVDGGRRSRKLAPKLDLKGVRGYVAAPPSLHPAGHRYEWLVPIVENGKFRPPLNLPDSLEAWMREQDREAERTPMERPVVQELAIEGGNLQLVEAPATLTGLVVWLQSQTEGNRNDGLYWAACSARDDGFSIQEALDTLGEAARVIGLDAHEARTAIRSAYRGRR